MGVARTGGQGLERLADLEDGEVVKREEKRHALHLHVNPQFEVMRAVVVGGSPCVTACSSPAGGTFRSAPRPAHRTRRQLPDAWPWAQPG